MIFLGATLVNTSGKEKRNTLTASREFASAQARRANPLFVSERF